MTIILELTDIEEKILLSDMINIETWIINVIQNKLRKQSDILVEKAFLNTTAVILTDETKGFLQTIIPVGVPLKNLDTKTKELILNKAIIKSAFECSLERK